MPLTKSAKNVLKRMERQYGKKKGKSVYYGTAAKQGRSERSFRKTRAKSASKASRSRGRKKVSIVV